MSTSHAVHAMLDLETLGIKEDCAVLQIACQTFNPYQVGEFGNCFNAFTDVKSQPERIIYPDTLKWWMSQDLVLFKEIINSPNAVSLKEGLDALVTYLRDNKVKFIWANSPSFDVSIIRNACEYHKVKFPIFFWNERDVRTIKGLTKIGEEDVEDERAALKLPYGKKHDAREDVLNQIILMQLSLRDFKLSDDVPERVSKNA